MRTLKSVSNRRAAETLYATSAVLVFVVAAFVRLGGVPHGEPFIPDMDEPRFIRPALHILASGDWNPRWFGHPGSLTIYSLAGVYAAQAALQGESLANLPAAYARDPDPFHILGKQLIVFCSILTHAGLWLLARRFVSRWLALLAVLLLACAPLDISHAALVRTDTQQSLLLVVLCLFLVSAVRTGRAMAFALAGLFLGFATAVKWPSVIVCLPIVLASWLTDHERNGWLPSRQRFGRVGLAGLTSVFGLFLAAPYVLLDFGTVLHNVAHEARGYHLSAASPGFFSALWYYLSELGKNLSIPTLLLAFTGLALEFRTRRWREHAVVVALLGSYLLFISLQSLRWARWFVPLLPYVCLWAALGTAHAGAWIRQRLGQGVRSGFAVASLAGVVTLAGCSQVLEVLQKRARDPTPLASKWILTNIPSGSKVLVERFTPPMPTSDYDVYVVDNRSGRLKKAEHTAKHFLAEASLLDLDRADLATSAVDYLILGNYHKRAMAEPKRYARNLRVYGEVLRDTERLKKIGPYEIRRVKKARRGSSPDRASRRAGGRSKRKP